MTAPTPENELERIEELKKYDILDTLPEQSYNDVVAIHHLFVIHLLP